MNRYGETFNFSLFGESHGEAIGATINNIAPGIIIDFKLIDDMLEKRSAKSNISTSRHESDNVKFISGYFNGYTSGSALTFIIENDDVDSSDYEKNVDILRPSHADYSANEKYLGYQDYRGGGQFSGRLTAVLVVVGAIATQILSKHRIYIKSHILELKGIEDKPFYLDAEDIATEIAILNNKDFPTICNVEEEMKGKILQAKKNDDSIGGVIETVAINVEPGLGEPYFSSLESKIASIFYSIPAVKGVEFGLGFNYKKHYASETNDEFYYEGTKVRTTTNNNGGINGGISNGMPILVKTIIKPTPSIAKVQNTVNLKTKKNTTIKTLGRHDPAIVHRSCVILDSCMAIALLDLYTMRYGYLWQK